jgi:hypothetical protein
MRITLEHFLTIQYNKHALQCRGIHACIHADHAPAHQHDLHHTGSGRRIDVKRAPSSLVWRAWPAYITSAVGALVVAVMLSTCVVSARAVTLTDLDQVASHVKASMSTDLFNNFSLFVYVDKAESGSLAQRMYVFEKSGDDDLTLIDDWPVSTGRETAESAHGQRRSTTTPTGFYELDPKRLYVDHTSSQWEAPMPYAMFFNWRPDGLPTGLAIHGVVGTAAGVLGQRASAGCVHLSVENAECPINRATCRARGNHYWDRPLLRQRREHHLHRHRRRHHPRRPGE